METVILFKIKAWLDMKERRMHGKQVDRKNLKKHKNDIFRLLANITPSSKVETAKEIQEDLRQFMELIADDQPDLMHLGINNTNLDELVEILQDVFLKK